jgi:WD40 repeat protein
MMGHFIFTFSNVSQIQRRCFNSMGPSKSSSSRLCRICSAPRSAASIGVWRQRTLRFNCVALERPGHISRCRFLRLSSPYMFSFRRALFLAHAARGNHFCIILTYKASTLIAWKGPIFAVRFSKDGKWLLTASLDNTVCLWDINAKELNAQYRTHTGNFAAAFSPYLL